MQSLLDRNLESKLRKNLIQKLNKDDVNESYVQSRERVTKVKTRQFHLQDWKQNFRLMDNSIHTEELKSRLYVLFN